MHLLRPLLLAAAISGLCAAARAGDTDPDHPPFDFTDAFYLANGIDPTTLIGRPDGTPPGSVVDHATPHGPQFNDVRILALAAAFDDSGHPVFFYVTGLPTPASFLPNAAGQEALAIADQYKVYEFPRASNPPFAVFPKRQDLIADLSNGYFSNDPLGIWQVNDVRYTPAALTTPGGQAALAELAARNGLDLDGTPVIRTKSEVLALEAQGYVTIEVPPVGTPGAVRWFFCPVLKDPRGGEIAPDAHLDIVRQADGSVLPAEQEIFDLFHCLQQTGDDCDDGGFQGAIDTFGFGSAAACPCGNGGGPQAGCANSTGQGGRLVGSGTPRVSNDTVVLSGSQMPNAPVLYFQGSAQASVVVGDGLRVAGGSIVRLGTRVNAGGASSFGPGIAALGGVVPSTTRYYQAWYRDPAAFCTADAFNLTNGVAIVWVP